jgi:pimeloyl-ACP methyl ester carboxylesterase
MRKVRTLLVLGASLLAASALAAVHPFPSAFKTQIIAVNGARIYVRAGGDGPAVVLLHGYGETGDMWEPLAATLVGDHTVIVPDLRGMGLSEHVAAGYDKKTEGRDVSAVLDALKDPKHFDEASRQHYAKLYALPGAMHSGFEQFHAFDQDVIDNRAFLAQGPLPMPVLAIGGEKSFGPMMATVARAAATNVQGAVIPGSGHWLMEEQPQATIAVIVGFLR